MAPKKTRSAKETAPGFKFPPSFTNLPSLFSKQYFKPVATTVLSDQIITIDKAFSAELCNELIRLFQSQLTMETTPLIKSKMYAARYNDRCSLQDPVNAHNLWLYLKQILLDSSDEYDEDMAQIRPLFEDAVSLNPQLRIYRYKKGHHFGQHYDDSVECKVSNDLSKTGVTKWTLLIYLTGDDEFTGGDTIFYPNYRGTKPIPLHPSKGMALLHKHGDDCLKHEAGIVVDGEKWVLRSDVTFMK